MAVSIGQSLSRNGKPAPPTDLFSAIGQSLDPGRNINQLGQAVGAVGNAFANGAQQLGNFGGKVVNSYQNVLGDGAPQPFDPAGAGFNNPGRAASQAEGQAQANQDYANAHPAPQAAYQPQSLGDFLGQALGMYKNYDPGTIYDPQIAQARANAATNDTNVKGMYAGLVQELAAQTAPIAQGFDNAGAQLKQQSADAQSSVNNAYGGAAASQQAALNALGIAPQANANLAQQNSTGGDQASAISRLALNAQANQGANTEHGATAQAYNSEIANSANSAGALARAQIQQDLFNKVTDLQTQASQARYGQLGNAISLANMMNTDEFNRQQQSDLNLNNAQKLQLSAQQKPGKPTGDQLMTMLNNYVQANPRMSAQDYARVVSSLGTYARGQ